MLSQDLLENFPCMLHLIRATHDRNMKVEAPFPVLWVC